MHDLLCVYMCVCGGGGNIGMERDGCICVYECGDLE